MANQYVDHAAPWELHKTGAHGSLDTAVYTTAESLRIIGAALWPFLPRTSRMVFEQLGLRDLKGYPQVKALTEWGQLTPGTEVSKPVPLFPRIMEPPPEETPAESQPSSGKRSKKKGKQKEDRQGRGKGKYGKDAISFEEFKRIDLRSGRVLKAERVPDTDRLLKVTVDIGEERTLVAGLGESYAPEELEGRTVLVVANLEPAKIRGLISEGMILAVETDTGLGLVTFSEEVAPGKRVS